MATKKQFSSITNEQKKMIYYLADCALFNLEENAKRAVEKTEDERKVPLYKEALKKFEQEIE